MLAGLILAGGKSSRMGTDKSLLILPDSQQSLLEHHQKRLALVCEDNIFISGSQHEQGIPDIIPNCGPLSGIHAAITHILLHHSKISELLVIAVDMPDLCSDDYNHLLKVGRENNCLCFFEKCFLPLYIPIGCELTEYLEKVFKHPPDEALMQSKQQQYSMKMMLDSLQGLQIQPFKNTQLDNINTPLQWQQCCKGRPYSEA
ncbi:MAG: molybdopterin-guanine dinucleotide biosynthesis protein A [Paraglaciecola sp.]|jgi:molybdopterin-guanine dinucleotide biosynthesis protein A